MKESRRQKRVPLHIPVLLCTDPQGSRVKGNAVVVDLSAKGLGFETDAELKRGDLLFLKLFLPITFACHVRNINSKTGDNYRCGAKIERIGLLDRLKLRDFINIQISSNGADRGRRS
ncbi:MAG: PilZ domain-containing protein [Elusimicrobia bacterium]|nr:PilZ domain-containing protein [Elusimicrobiota bacterium]